MVSLTRSNAILELGKRLVSQLDVADDFLASWMAHYVAQRINDAEEAPEEGKAAARDSCAKAVLELWEHRSSLPDQLRPLKDLDPVLRALASLDVERTDYRYYPEALREAEKADENDDAKKWLSVATGMDYSARLLIQFALRSAAHVAASQAGPWVELAANAGANDHTERVAVRFILEDEAVGDIGAAKNALMKDRISRLEYFASMAQAVAAELRTQLDVNAPQQSEEPSE